MFCSAPTYNTDIETFGRKWHKTLCQNDTDVIHKRSLTLPGVRRHFLASVGHTAISVGYIWKDIRIFNRTEMWMENSITREMSCLMTKPTKWHVCPAKTDQPGHLPSLIESSLCAWRNLGSLSAQRRLWLDWADAQADLRHSEDSDQTGWMPRLIWVFAWRTCHFVGFVVRRLKCI